MARRGGMKNETSRTDYPANRPTHFHAHLRGLFIPASLDVLVKREGWRGGSAKPDADETGVVSLAITV